VGLVDKKEVAGGKVVYLNCPEKDSLRDSYAIEETEKQRQKG
jgi:hypothetical protein